MITGKDLVYSESLGWHHQSRLYVDRFLISTEQALNRLINSRQSFLVVM